MPYDPKAIDYFFIVDGDYNMYLIPSGVIAGRVTLTLRTYGKYIVGNAGGLLEATADAARPMTAGRVGVGLTESTLAVFAHLRERGGSVGHG